MKTNLSHILTAMASVVILSVITACGESTSMREMDRADAIVDQYPDSALTILGAIDASSLRGSEEKARHGLLSALAMLKTSAECDYDSILAPAWAYYGKKDIPSRETMLTHFLLAHSKLKSGEDSLASFQFEIVIKIGTKIKDPNYPGLAEASRGFICSARGETENAIAHFLSSIDYLERYNGLVKYRIYSHLSVAEQYCALNSVEKARTHLNIAMELSDASGIKEYLGGIAETRGVVDFYAGNSEEACKDFEKADSLGRELYYRSLTFWVIAAFETGRAYAPTLHKSTIAIRDLTESQKMMLHCEI